MTASRTDPSRFPNTRVKVSFLAGERAARNPRIGFSVPALFNLDQCGELASLQTKWTNGRCIGEIYGCLCQSPLGHGRSARAVAQVHDLHFIRLVRDRARAHEIGFNYLFNAPFNPSQTTERVARDHIADVLDTVAPDSVTVTSPRIAALIRKESASIRLCISTIAGVKSFADLVPFMRYNPTIVTPHHDLSRTPAALHALVQTSRERGIEVQLLVNESCVFGCTCRTEHYQHLSSGANDDRYQASCNMQKTNNPELLLQSGWIRPEDVAWMSSEYGITRFKITDRAKPPSWILQTVAIYLRGTYGGNLLRILGTTPPWTKRPWEQLYLYNPALDGFLGAYPADPTSARSYCNAHATSLQEQGLLKIVQHCQGKQKWAWVNATQGGDEG